MTKMIFGTDVVLLLDKSITYFVTFQNLLLTYAINCSDLIVAVFLDASFGI